MKKKKQNGGSVIYYVTIKWKKFLPSETHFVFTISLRDTLCHNTLYYARFTNITLN